MRRSCFVCLAVAVTFSMHGNSAPAALINVSASNYASDYAIFNYDYGAGPSSYSPYNNVSQNSDVNSSASVNDFYSFDPYYPTVLSYAYAANGTDFSTYVYALSSNNTYGNPTSLYGADVYSSVFSQSYVYFTLTENSTAIMYLEAGARTNHPGDFGNNHSYAHAELYNYTTGADYYYDADAVGGGNFVFSTSMLLTLDAGDYRLAWGYSYANGYSLNGYGYNEQANYALAELYNIQAIPTPEPGTLTLAAIGFAGFGGMACRRRKGTGSFASS